jgi:nucleoid DNA-binding protein
MVIEKLDDLVRALADHLPGVKKRTIKRVLKAQGSLAHDMLKKEGDRIKIPGIVTLRLVKTTPRAIKHLQTGEEILIPRCLRLSARTSVSLRRRINRRLSDASPVK